MNIRKETKEEAAADESNPGRKPRWVAGRLSEPLRPIHALPLVLGVGGQMSILLSSGNGLAAFAVFLAGAWIGGLGIDLDSQARLAIRAESEKRERLGGAELGVLEKGVLTAREFSRLTCAKAKMSALDTGFKYLARPIFWAQEKTGNMPRVNAAISRLEPAMEELTMNSKRADFEWELRKGAARCKALFFMRLKAMEAEDWSYLAEELEPLWRASGLTGASVEARAAEKGSVAKRLSAAVMKLEADPNKLMKVLDPGELGVLRGMIRLCEVSAEAVELAGVVGEARPAIKIEKAAKARL